MAESPSRLGRHGLFAFITLLLSLGVALTAAEWMLDYQRQHIESSDRMDPGMIRYDPQLGWRLSPGWSGAHHHYDFDVEYSVNRFGFRGEYAKAAGGKTTAVLGDSFTFGLGVNDDQTFVQRLNGGADAFLNFAVPGYSTDQQVLQIRERVELFKPDRILLVVYLANDLFDNQQPYPLQADFAKPLFRLDDQGRLVLENTPVPRQSKPAVARGMSLSQLVVGDEVAAESGLSGWLGQLELFRRLGLLQPRPQVPDELFSRRFEPAVKLFMALIQAVAIHPSVQGIDLTVVLLSGRSHVQQPESVSARYQEYLRRQLSSRLRQVSLPVIDVAGQLQAAYREGSTGLYYANEGHLTPRGHRMVASLLRKGLNPAGSRQQKAD